MFVQMLVLAVCNMAVIHVDAQKHSQVLQSEIRKYVAKIAADSLIPSNEKNPELWKDIGRRDLEHRLRKQHLNTNKAKNIIVFMGDGMSSSTVTAARILQGQRQGKLGEEGILSFELFPYTGFSKTYCTNAQVADSACSATALLCGVKANIFTVGVNANVHFNNCTESMDPKNHASSIADWAQRARKSTGFVTTTTLTHASPSGLYAHAANRLFESDADVESYGADPTTCMDMAAQLVTQRPGRNFNVLMGGGKSKFLPNNVRDGDGTPGQRKDGKDLLKLWQNMHPEGVIVENREQLLSVSKSNVRNIMGVFNSSYMDYHSKADPFKQPTLTEMTEAAIKVLRRNRNGYFLFVEGGLIDVAHHETKAALALDETLELAKAVQRARKITDESDTLIITTADHGHPLTITGYSVRGNDILGVNKHLPDSNGKKYMTLNYAMGPNQYLDQNGTRLSMESVEKDADLHYPAYIKSKDSRHSGDDVPIYASGPFAHLFSGLLEQSSIPHIIAYAACLGNGRTICSERKTQGWIKFFTFLNPNQKYDILT